MHEDFRNYVEELLANQPCPVDTWIHLQNCPKCSQELEALRKLSGLFLRGASEAPEQDPLFYTGVQARIAHLYRQSPWRVFLETGWAKRLVLTCLACTGLIAFYLFQISSEEYNGQTVSRAADLTGLEPAERRAQRDAVLVNFVLDSKPADETNH
jgi:hypothetical protein